jgi:hypothetical protein
VPPLVEPTPLARSTSEFPPSAATASAGTDVLARTEPT